MSTYFIFSDECGECCGNLRPKSLRAHPYYIRSALIVSSEEWKAINNRMRYLKKSMLNLSPNNYEIKWSYLWNKKSYERKGEEIPQSKAFYFLNDIEYDTLIDFVDKALGILSEISYCRIILTVTFNRNHSEDIYKIYRWHIQDIMQRIEMELAPNNLGVLFIDPVSTDKNKLFRDVYHDLYRNDLFINEYTCIKDSLNIEYSHHSVGIQIADYIAGCFSGFLRGFKVSTGMYSKRVTPFLRCDENNNILGYGIREVPRNNIIREEINKRSLEIL